MADVHELTADVLERLADGERVELGVFSGNAEAPTEADLIAERLREIAVAERDGSA